ncbi:uncharacterized protein LDX57_001806 [Aspergillus melleus]|uniref:uncharacterized protein n=1 Tax=Aspergillus melleus TaxID=138277 RepID=UPI001E8D47B7|nr:uncharacterized protein LDX57_001806 [Aspergillus melleus]KAH8424050.1 hypothetical protein LDX57_001806 [Aspergillus melleus]
MMTPVQRRRQPRRVVNYSSRLRSCPLPAPTVVDLLRPTTWLSLARLGFAFHQGAYRRRSFMVIVSDAGVSHEQPVSVMAKTGDLLVDAGNGGLGSNAPRLNYHVPLTVPLGPLGQIVARKYRRLGLTLYNNIASAPFFDSFT